MHVVLLKLQKAQPQSYAHTRGDREERRQRGAVRCWHVTCFFGISSFLFASFLLYFVVAALIGVTAAAVIATQQIQQQAKRRTIPRARRRGNNTNSHTRGQNPQLQSHCWRPSAAPRAYHYRVEIIAEYFSLHLLTGWPPIRFVSFRTRRRAAHQLHGPKESNKSEKLEQ